MASVWTAMTETILEYTGLSSTVFFTIAAMMVVTYKVVCSMFVSADDFVPVKREPLHLGDLTEEELKAYNGSDSQKPLLIAIRGQIYDVSSSKYIGGTLTLIRRCVFSYTPKRASESLREDARCRRSRSQQQASNNLFLSNSEMEGRLFQPPTPVPPDRMSVLSTSSYKSHFLSKKNWKLRNIFLLGQKLESTEFGAEVALQRNSPAVLGLGLVIDFLDSILTHNVFIHSFRREALSKFDFNC